MDKSDLSRILQKNLIALLNQHNDMSMRQLSALLGKSNSYVQKIMNGTFLPPLDKLLEICDYFDISLATLLADDDNISMELKTAIERFARLSPESQHFISRMIAYLMQLEEQIDKQNDKNG